MPGAGHGAWAHLRSLARTPAVAAAGNALLTVQPASQASAASPLRPVVPPGRASSRPVSHSLRPCRNTHRDPAARPRPPHPPHPTPPPPPCRCRFRWARRARWAPASSESDTPRPSPQTSTTSRSHSVSTHTVARGTRLAQIPSQPMLLSTRREGSSGGEVRTSGLNFFWFRRRARLWLPRISLSLSLISFFLSQRRATAK